MSASGEQRASILVLEDDEGVRQLQQRRLARDGYRVRTAARIAEARRLLAEEAADLLVIDYQLEGGENGLEFYRELRAGGSRVPAVLVTGFSDEARLLEAMRAGVREFLPKTPNFVDLLAPTVEHVLARARQEQRLVEAEAAGRAKDEFLATLSHELRTPLTPVLALLPSLQADERLPPDVREDIATIERNISLEARLIDDLLDLTRIARGKIELNYSTVDLRALLDHTVESFCRMDAAAKGVRVEQELAPGSHVIAADGPRLTQVLWNLLKNATKFTPSGGRIVVRTRHESVDGRPWLAIEVEDSGIGIDPATLPHIFDAFEQGSRAITQKFGGLGLGLPISRAIVRLHEGTIAAQSEGRDRGARFTVRMPVFPSSARVDAPAAASPRETRPASEPGAHVLLVEDHADTARILGRLLRRAGFRVTMAHSIAEALVAAESAPAGERGPVRMVLSDLGLPDGTGVELMRRLTAVRSLPAIALSGFGMEDDVREALAAGFARHFTKPVEFERLLAAMRELLASEAGAA